MKWLYRNAVLGAALTASSNQLGYGASLLQDRSTKTKLKFTGSEHESVVVDLGLTERVKKDYWPEGAAPAIPNDPAGTFYHQSFDSDADGFSAPFGTLAVSGGKLAIKGKSLSPYPDNASGTTYIQDEWATVDGWNAVGGGAVSVASGRLRHTSASVGNEYIERFFTPSYDPSGRSIKAKVRLVAGTMSSITIIGAGYVTLGVSIIPTTSWQIFDINPTNNWSAVQAFLIFDFQGQSADCIIEFDFIYIGTGAYLPNSLLDTSGNGNHGTIYGATPDGQGGLSFDGVNDYAQVDLSGINPAYTLSARLRIAVGGLTQDIIYAFGTAGKALFLCRINASNQLLVVWTDSTVTTRILTGPTLVLGTYYDIAAVHTGSAVLLYVDGALAASTTTNATIIIQSLLRIRLGTHGNSVLNFFNGTILNPRIYNRPLSAEEVLNLYNETPFTTEYDGLIAMYSQPVAHAERALITRAKQVKALVSSTKSGVIELLAKDADGYTSVAFADIVAGEPMVIEGMSSTDSTSISVRQRSMSEAETLSVDEVYVGNGDYLAPKKVSGVGVLGHNLTELSTITLEANDVDTWTAPAFSRTLTWREALAELFDEQIYQFWRLSIDDPASVVPTEIGVLYLGEVVDVASVAPDAEISVESNDVVSDTRSGQVYGYSMFQAYTPAFNLHHVTDEKRKELVEVWASQSQVEPFILLVWEDSLDVLRPLYVRFTMTSFRFAKVPQHGLGYTASFSCREVF